MDKTVGKKELQSMRQLMSNHVNFAQKTRGLVYWLYFAAILCVPAYANIKLEATDSDGNQITQAVLGQPFNIEVIIEGATSQVRPEIQGLDKFYVRANGLFMTTINGRTTLKNKYRVRVDVPGTYTIGPAQAVSNGVQYSSNTISIKVGDQPVQNRHDKKESTAGGAFLRLTANKERVVVGETIKCSLRFYYGNDVTNLAPINQPQIPGFTMSESSEASRGTETINGKQYNYFEVQWTMSPTEVGKKAVPAYSADFTVRSRQQDFMSHLSMFLGHGGEPKRVYSNALNIQVDPLPAHNGDVHAIGSFSQFNAKLEPGVAKEGEGMVLTVELEGEGQLTKNILNIKVPDSFKYYDSKHYPVDNPQTGIAKNCFEFIVQGLQKGDWEIPSQKFCFYDTKNRKYKTLETLPITVTILPSQGTTQNFNVPIKTNNENDSLNPIDPTDDIKPLLKTGTWYKVAEGNLPWWLFIIFVLIPLLLLFYEWWYKVVLYSPASVSGRKQKMVFKNARTQIENAQKSGNVKSLYGTFIELFATRYKVDQTNVSQEFIMDKLTQAKLKPDELDQWQQFFNQLSEYVFFARAIKPGESAAFMQYARRWIDRFEQTL
jgi:hypothetical protein